MSTAHDKNGQRQYVVLRFMLDQRRPLRMLNFDPMIDTARARYGWQLFPLNGTTVKSTLILLLKKGHVKDRLVTVGKRRIKFYRVTAQGRKAYETLQESWHE